MTEPTQIAFVCVQNAGRSQLAYAFAERELEARNLERDFELVTGGTRPAKHVHPEVVEALEEVELDISARSPREVTVDEVQNSECVITMGCSTDDVCPAGWVGDRRDWELDDPDGCPPDEIAEIRDEIECRIAELFDDLVRDE